MRKVLLLLMVFAIAVIAYLFIPAFIEPNARSLSASQLELLGRVPEDADLVALVPDVASMYFKTRTHPLTRDAIADLRADSDPGPLPLLLGNSDLVIWRKGDETNYIARPDLLRRLILRLVDPRVVEREGIVFLGRVGESQASRPAFGGLLDGRAGHLFVWQREESRTFPPIPRPAASVVTLEEDAIRVLSFARGDGEARALPLPLPRSAMLAAIVSSAPGWIDDLEHALPIHIAPLFEQGALLALYQVENRPLLPRPFGVLAFPADSARAAELESTVESLLPLGVLTERSERTVRGVSIRRRNGIGFVVESARIPGAVVVAFDKTSIERYLADTMLEARDERFLWSVRLLPHRIVPVLEKVKENRGMRLVARDLSRGAERVYRSARWFQSADSIVSTASAEAGVIRLETAILAPK